MTFREQLKSDFDHVSRRQAKSVHCRVVTGKLVHELIRSTSSLLPKEYKINIDPITGMDAIRGYCIVYPLHLHEEYEELRQNLTRGGTVDADNVKVAETDTHKAQYRVSPELPPSHQEKIMSKLLFFVGFLKENCMLIRISRLDFPSDQVADGRNIDIMVESSDILQGVTARPTFKHFQSDKDRADTKKSTTDTASFGGD